jgi:hypothetical protein
MTRRKSILKSQKPLFDDSTHLIRDDDTSVTGIRNVSFSQKSKVRHIMPVKTLQQEFDMGDDSDTDCSLFHVESKSQSRSQEVGKQRKTIQFNQPESQSSRKKKQRARKSIFAAASDMNESQTQALGDFQPLPRFEQNQVTKNNLFDHTNVKPAFHAATTDDESNKENTFLNTSRQSGFSLNDSKNSGSAGTFSFRVDPDKNALDSSTDNTAGMLFKPTSQDSDSKTVGGSQQTAAFIMGKQKYAHLRQTTATPEPGSTPPQRSFLVEKEKTPTVSRFQDKSVNRSMNKSVTSVLAEKSVNKTMDQTATKPVNQAANKSVNQAQNRTVNQTVNQTLSNKTLGGETARIVRNTPTSASIEGDTMALMGADLNSFSQTSAEMDSTVQDTLTVEKNSLPVLVEKVSPEVVGIAQQIQDHTNDSINTVDANESRMQTLRSADEEMSDRSESDKISDKIDAGVVDGTVDDTVDLKVDDMVDDETLEHTTVEEKTLENIETVKSTTRKSIFDESRDIEISKNHSKLFSETDDSTVAENSFHFSFTQKPSQGPLVASQTQKFTIPSPAVSNQNLSKQDSSDLNTITRPDMDFTEAQNTKVDDILSFTQAQTSLQSSDTFALMNDKNQDQTCLKHTDMSMEFTTTKATLQENSSLQATSNTTSNHANSILNFTAAHTQSVNKSKMSEIQEEETSAMDIEETMCKTMNTQKTQETVKQSEFVVEEKSEKLNSSLDRLELTKSVFKSPMNPGFLAESSTLVDKSTVIHRPTMNALPVTNTEISPADSETLKATKMQLPETMKMTDVQEDEEELESEDASPEDSISFLNDQPSFNQPQLCSTKVLTSNDSSRVLTPNLSFTKIVTQVQPNLRKQLLTSRPEVLDTSNVSSAKLDLSEEEIDENEPEIEDIQLKKIRHQINSSFQKASTSYIRQTNVTFSPAAHKQVTLKRPGTAMGLQAISDTPLRSPVRVTRRNILKSGYSGGDETTEMRTQALFDKSIDNRKGHRASSLESFTVGFAAKNNTAFKTGKVADISETRISDINKIGFEETTEEDSTECMDDATTRKIQESEDNHDDIQEKPAKVVDIAADIFQHLTNRLFEAVSSQKQLTPELITEFDKLQNLERIVNKFIKKAENDNNAREVYNLFQPILTQSLTYLVKEAKEVLNSPSSDYLIEISDEMLPAGAIQFDSDLSDDLLRKKLCRMNAKLVRVLQDFNAYLVNEITEKIVNEYEKVKETHAKTLAEQQLPGADHEFCGETVLSQIYQVYQMKIDHENKKLEYQVKQKQADDWYQKHEIERKRQMEEAYEERVRGDLIKAYLHKYLVNTIRKEEGERINSSIVEFNNGAVLRITPNLFSTKTNLRYNVKLLKSHKVNKNQIELIQSGRSLSETGPNDSEFYEKFLQKYETFAFHQLLEKRREHFLYNQDDKYTWDDETCQILPKGTKSKAEALEYPEQVKSHMLKLFTS